MKYSTLIFGLLVLSPTLGFSQDSKTEQASVQVQSSKKETEGKKAVVAPAKPTSEILGKRVTYGGYLSEVSRTEKGRSLFSLRSPLDRQKESENVSFYPGTEKVQGIVLFSIKF